MKLCFNFCSLKCLKPSRTHSKNLITLVFWQTYNKVGAATFSESDTFYLVRVDGFFVFFNFFFALKIEMRLVHTVCDASFTGIIWKRYLRHSFLKALDKRQRLGANKIHFITKILVYYEKSYWMCGPRVYPHNLDGSEIFPIFQITKDI